MDLSTYKVGDEVHYKPEGQSTSYDPWLTRAFTCLNLDILFGFKRQTQKAHSLSQTVLVILIDNKCELCLADPLWEHNPGKFWGLPVFPFSLALLIQEAGILS